jgi:hypothetical protein
MGGAPSNALNCRFSDMPLSTVFFPKYDGGMVTNQEELLNRFPLLESIISSMSCSDADKKLLLTLFLNVYLTGQKDCQDRSLL